MNSEEGQLSPSGVFIAADFRANLIIDRYDPVFADMRASKLKHLCGANSEDAVTWNVFRSLRQIAPRPGWEAARFLLMSLRPFLDLFENLAIRVRRGDLLLEVGCRKLSLVFNQVKLLRS